MHLADEAEVRGAAAARAQDVEQQHLVAGALERLVVGGRALGDPALRGAAAQQDRGSAGGDAEEGTTHGAFVDRWPAAPVRETSARRCQRDAISSFVLRAV